MNPELSSARSARTAVLACLALAALPAWGAFEWFLCRVEPPSDKIVVVIAKTGTNAPMDRIIALPGEKGIQPDVLKPGARSFLNPFFYDWELHAISDVPQGQVGILVRKFGSNPDPEAYALGNFIVGKNSDKKGIVDEVLPPGRYPINPYAYELLTAPSIQVPTGFVGVVTKLVGDRPKTSNQYLSGPGERGVQRETLSPGTYFKNPYVERVDNVDVRTKRLELAADKDDRAHGVVAFFSSDGFEIDVHLTTTWQIDEKRAPEVFARATTAGNATGLEEELISKILRPAIRGIARVEGSKFPTIDYIGGASRLAFQSGLHEKLKAACAPYGVIVHEILVNDIATPKEIAEPIREREIAKEELSRNLNQIRQAVAEQSLARQTALVAQEKARVEAETARLQATIKARNNQDVALIDQEKLLEVAKTDLVSAKAQASAILARGEAESEVIKAQNEAEAAPLRASVLAFKSGADFAAYTFARRVGPSIHGIFADPEGPFGKLFTETLGARKSADKAGER